MGLDYYDRFEWLIRTDLRCGNDNLIVERYREGTEEFTYEEAAGREAQLQYGDHVIVQSQTQVSANPSVYTEKMLRLLATGAVVSFEQEGLQIDRENRDSAMMLLRQQYYAAKLWEEKRHREGVARAKARGEYRGRKKIAIEEERLKEIAALFHQKKISEKQAMERLGIASRSTFYRRLKETRE